MDDIIINNDSDISNDEYLNKTEYNRDEYLNSPVIDTDDQIIFINTDGDEL